MKKILRACMVLSLAVVYMMCHQMPVFAETDISVVKSMVRNSTYLDYNGQSLYTTVPMAREEFLDELFSTMQKTFRASTYLNEIYFYYYEANSTKAKYRVECSEMDSYADIQAKTDDFVDRHIHDIVSDGMDKEAAIRAVFEWVCEYAEYDRDAVKGTDLYYEEQTIESMLDTGKGVCVGYALLFRSLMEAVPFCNGMIDFENGQDQITVAIVRNPGVHSWCAVEEDGSWYHYDLSGYDTTGSDREDYYRASLDTIFARYGYDDEIRNELEWNY